MQDNKNKIEGAEKPLRYTTIISVSLIFIGFVAFIYPFLMPASPDGSDGIDRAFAIILGLNAIVFGTGGLIVSTIVARIVKNRGANERKSNSLQPSKLPIVIASFVLMCVVVYFMMTI